MEQVQTVKLNPSKHFFVAMLTRDIELKDAVLDLLDNCLDGALRTLGDKFDPSRNDIYRGFRVDINMRSDSFEIKDNCGGIPVDLAVDYAFKLGRPVERDECLPTVGVYGIGMKRAIFKMGDSANICSSSKEDSFRVLITPEWMAGDSWELPLEISSANDTSGTIIKIGNIKPGISRLLSDETNFGRDLRHVISTHYSVLIQKGFEIYVNGVVVDADKIRIFHSESAFTGVNGMAPYIYKNKIEGVDVIVMVGFYRNIISDMEEEDLISGKSTSDKAGWTIICNDRAVLYSDKTKVTGWGEAGVPQYHTQFINIAGMVIFRSNDASKLPLTTTKRGIEGNSELYLTVKDKMREGLKIFTSYTNKLKKFDRQSLAICSEDSRYVDNISAEKIIETLNVKWENPRAGGMVFKPNLPNPAESNPIRQIKFSKNISDIRKIGEYLLDDPDATPSEVGSACFDVLLKEAGK